MSSINENLWNKIELDTSTSLNNDECWNHTNNCIDWAGICDCICGQGASLTIS